MKTFLEINENLDLNNKFLVHVGKGVDSFGYEWFRYPDDFDYYDFEEIISNVNQVLDKLLEFISNKNLNRLLFKPIHKMNIEEFNQLIDIIVEETGWRSSDVIIINQEHKDIF